MNQTTFSMTALFVMLTLGVAAAQKVDTVVPRSGSPVRGTVVGVSRTEVTLDSNDTQRKIPANSIRYIVFGGEPSTLRQIRDAAKTGNVERAERYLERLDPDTLENKYSKADYAFYKALTQKHKAVNTGEGLAEATKAMLAFVTSNRQTFHFYDAAEALGDLAVAMQRPDGAARYYGQLENAPWPETQFRGTVRMAAALRAQGGDQLAAALQRYDTIASANVEGEDSARQKRFAIAGKASCQAEMGKPAEGIAALEPLIAETASEDAELLAAAYNALGDCHRAAGNSKDALLSYLHVDLLFPSQPAARAEALYHISQLWTELGRADRADEAKQTLQTEYAATKWAKKVN